MGRKRSQYYIDPVELKEEIRKFQAGGEDEKMSDKLGKMLIKLAERFASRPNFYRYSYKEDFVSDAILRMIQQIHKINLEHPKCNPFTYLTMTCYHVFIAKITKEKKFTETKEALKDKYYDMFEINEGLNLKKKSNEDK
jgi:DNA-directed RNA polymerase specialized sigma24 family protein